MSYKMDLESSCSCSSQLPTISSPFGLLEMTSLDKINSLTVATILCVGLYTWVDGNAQRAYIHARTKVTQIIQFNLREWTLTRLTQRFNNFEINKELNLHLVIASVLTIGINTHIFHARLVCVLLIVIIFYAGLCYAGTNLYMLTL